MKGQPMPRDIYLEGSVGMAFWPEDPHFTPAMVRAQLAGQGDVTVHVNSGGGVAADGLAIYHVLRDHPGKVTVKVTGVAVSAASLLVMAADHLIMRQGSALMIHDPAAEWTAGRGTEDDHLAAAAALATLSNGYAAIYAARAGITADEAREIMRAETWFGPEEAVAAGFADEVETVEAEAPAEFAYAAYSHAPRRLLAGTRASPAERTAVLAMMCGQPAPTQKETMMTEEEKAAAAAAAAATAAAEAAAAAEEEEAAARAAEEEEAAAAAAAAATAEGEGEDDDEDEFTPEAAIAIMDMVAMHGGGVDVARQFIAERTPLTGVIAHYRQKGPSVSKHKPGGATARITRDERDTRRQGMAAALAAKLARRDPTDGSARPFMQMRLSEMALASLTSDERARMSLSPNASPHDAASKQQVYMAMHTTSDFPLSLQNAMNKELERRFTEAVPTYRKIARSKMFMDFRPHPVIRPGDFPTLQPVGEGGEIKYGTIGEKNESVALVPYAVAVSISRQVLINDDIGAIADMIADQGRAVSRFEEVTFYAMMLGGANGDGPTLLETGRQVFNTTDGTKAGTAAAITVPSLSLGRAAIMKRKSVDGNDLGIMPSILLVGPDKLTEAQQIVAPIQADQAGNVNPFAGLLRVEATAKITGNAWYLFVDPADGNFVYGYLEGAAAPRTRVEEPFGRQGMQMSLEHDFGVGAVDFRGGWKNAGA